MNLQELNAKKLKVDIDLFELGMLYAKQGVNRIDALREVMPKLHPEAVEVSPGIWMTSELFEEMKTNGI